MMRCRLSEKRGHVAVEIVCAISILGVIGFGSFGLYQYGVDQLRVSTERTVAVRALENESERLRSVSVSELDEFTDQSFQVAMPELELLRDAVTSISVVPYAEDADVRVVNLSVSWNSHAGRSITEELNTLRAF